MSDVSKVMVGSVETAWVVKVLGRGTMEYCSDLFEFLSSRISPESPVDSVYFELSETTYLDSSFIGVIVSIQKKLQRVKGTEVIILNPSDKVKEILNTMGLFEILPIQENNTYLNLAQSQEISQKLDKTYHDIQILLESHQNLMEVNTENRKRFSLVEEMLKKELERQKP